MRKIVIAEPIGLTSELKNEFQQKLKQIDCELICYEDKPQNSDDLTKRIKSADFLIISNFPLKKENLESAPNLQYISVAFTGVDHVDIATCREKNIKISNAAGYATEAVAELTIGLIIGLYRSIQENHKKTQSGLGRDSFLGLELAGKTVGLIGLGAIGKKTAEILQAFGCEILAYTRTPKKIPNINFVELSELLSRSDIISLHVPLNPNTKQLIGEKELNLMKKSAILINTARGPVVDQEALARALNNNQIAGAAVDVYEIEPPLPPNHVILDAQNIITLPHIAYATQESFAKRAYIVFENIFSYLEGNQQNIVL